MEQVFDRGVGRVHHLPGEAEAPGFFGVLGEMGGVAAMLIPDVAFAVLHFGHDDRATAFREEQERHRGADARVAFGVPVSFPVVRERILFADEHLGAFAIPIVFADEAMGGEAAGAFEAVEIVVETGLAAAGGARVVIDGEATAEPVDGAVEFVVVDMWAAADDVAVFDGGVAGFKRGGGDGEAADAGAGHAAGAGVAGDVAPGAVFVLRARPSTFARVSQVSRLTSTPTRWPS